MRVTAPPFHVYCRSTTVPYFDDDFDIGERAAREENGKTYYVPDDMSYKEWKETFVDGKTQTKNNVQEVEKELAKDGESGIIKVNKTTLQYKANSVTEVINKKGGIDRNYYGDDGKQIKQISNHNHGNPKEHPYGKNGEHAHDYIYDENGKLIGRPKRELNETEKGENGDIL